MQKSRILTLYSSFIALGSLLALMNIFSSPSESDNRLLLGLSLPRFVFAAGLSVVLVLFTVLAVRSMRDKAWAEKFLDEWLGSGRFSGATGWLAGISFGLSWIAFFIPDYRSGEMLNYLIRGLPVIVFLLLASMATLIVLFIGRSKSVSDLERIQTLKLGLTLFVIIGLVWIVLFATRFGVSGSEDFWYGAGVPLLASQWIGAMLGGLVFLQFEKKLTFKRADLIIFILIYVVTAIFWAWEPLHESFLFDAPRPPNRVFYPYADAQLFDMASQFALIGQRMFIYNSSFFERPLYLSFLVYLHTIFGQKYETLMAAQAAMFAILPALIYLIGRSLKMRAVGFAAAIVASVRGLNAIASSNMIDMANPKMILTDFPAAIGVALVVLLACEWLKAPPRNWQYALWIGAAIGGTIMLRTNGVMLLVLIPFYAAIKFYPDWKKWLVQVSLIGIAVFAITLPWELRNISVGGQMYGSIISKFRNVFERRYTPPPESSSSISDGLSLLSFKSTQMLLVLSRDGMTLQDGQACDSVICFTSNHFLHNIVTSILVLPVSPVLADVQHTVWTNNQYWFKDWDGTLPVATHFFVAVNLFLILLGIVAAWRKQRWLGLTPFAVFIFYDVSNAFARTSGGRYIVPMDWILTIYFLLGVFYIVTWLANTVGIKWNLFGEAIVDQGAISEPFTWNGTWKLAAIFVIILGIGALIPFSENLHSRQFRNADALKTLKRNNQALSTIGLNVKTVEEFLKTENAEILIGRGLYPRYYLDDETAVHFHPFAFTGFQRTIFALIGPKKNQSILLAGDEIPKYFPNGSDVLVVGCSDTQLNYVDALFIIVLGENNQIAPRVPTPEKLQCPFTSYVCTDNLCQ